MDTVKKNISPIELLGDDKFKSGLSYYAFCWRWINIDHDQYRILTLEYGQADNQVQNRVISPAAFFPYELCMQGKLFCKEFIRVNNGNKYWVLGIGNDDEQTKLATYSEVQPNQLFWSGNAQTDGEEYQFGYVGKVLDEVKRTFVILQSHQHINPSGIQPCALFDDAYKPIVENKAFCWRWIKKDNQEFRALTIEGCNIPDMPSPKIMSKQLGLQEGIFKPISIKVDSGYDYYVVALEVVQTETESQPEVSPGSLRWLDLAEENCNEYSFTSVNGFIPGYEIVCLADN